MHSPLACFPEQFTALVAPRFVLSAVLCEVTFNVTPIAGHIGERTAPGTIMG